MDKLKNCPLCDSDDVGIHLIDGTGLYYAVCNDCDCGSTSYEDPRDASVAWNKRPALTEAAPDMLAACEKIVAYGEIWEMEGTISETELELIDAARAAIAKAKREE